VVTAETLDRDTADPVATDWLAGLAVADVAAGRAVDREYVLDDCARSTAEEAASADPTVGPLEPERAPAAGGARPAKRRDLAADLFAGLDDGTHHALVGPVGSGTSTVCRDVAGRWARTNGPVLYRANGCGHPVDVAAVTTWLDAVDGRPLVVVEDAAWPGGSEVFEVLGRDAGTDDEDGPAFLFEAREGEWADPPAEIPRATDGVRVRDVRAVTMPSLDEETVAAFVDRVASATGRPVEATPDALLSTARSTATETVTRPGDVLSLVHRLVQQSGGADGGRSLTATVRETYHELADRGEAVLAVGVAANLLNAAGLPVRPALLHAVDSEVSDGDTAETGETEAVEAALSVLEGTVVTTGADGVVRAGHDGWSRVFLAELLSDRDDGAAATVVDCVTAVLAVAGDDDPREQAAAAAGDPDALADVAADPRAWATTVVERLFALGRTCPELSPLYDRAAERGLELPGCCPPSLSARVVLWSGEMALAAGDHDRAAEAFERLEQVAHDGVGDDGPGEQGTGTSAEELVARSLFERGRVEYARGNPDAAAEYLDRGSERYRNLGDRRQVGECRKQLGNVAWLRGDLELAERRYRECLVACRDLDDRLGEAYVLHNLGNVVDARGDDETAERLYRDALDIYRAVSDRSDEADCLNNLGVLAENRGDLETAEEFYGRSLARYRDVGDRRGAANAMHNLGMVARKRGDLDDAAAYGREAVATFREVEDGGGEAATTRLLAAVARERGDLERAAERARRSRDRWRAIDDSKGEATALEELARVKRDRGDVEGALADVQHALAIERDVGQPRREAECLRLLARIDRGRGEYTDAREHLAAALNVVRDVGDTYREAAVLDERGEFDAECGHPSSAATRFEEAAARYETAGALPAAVDASLRAADVLAAAGEETAARDRVDRARELAVDAGLDDRAATARDRLSDASR
jgi:tetratricopeptide (TPR) repeat protein